MTETFSDKKVCVVIPTFKRSYGLKAAIESLFNQDTMDPNIRILVVDNNPVQAEKELVERLSHSFQHPIDYVHEEKAGVSNARNAAMKCLGDTRYLAFLDDDMTVSPKWLSSLISTSQAFRAGLVFGPTYAILPNKDDPRNQYMTPFFSRLIDKAEDGIVEQTLGTGGCLLDLQLCEIPNPPFNPDLNERGGEDDIFFDELRQTGTLVAWSTEAVSYEIVPLNRANVDYIWKRNFGYGQGPTRIYANRGFRGIGKVLYHMSVGCAQFIIYAPYYLFLKIRRKPSAIKYLALTARSLGKVFWVDKFSPLLYGNGS